MLTGSVTLTEVIEAFKYLGGEANAKDIQDFIIKERGGILPKIYEYGGWQSYRNTITQVIHSYCPGCAKYRSDHQEHFKKTGRGKFTLLGFSRASNDLIVESRQYESHSYGQKTLISENEFEDILEENKKTSAIGETIVIEYEKNWLMENGRSDLAENILQISKESVSAGYDIVSYDLEGNKKYIEVKSSKSSNSYFYLTEPISKR